MRLNLLIPILFFAFTTALAAAFVPSGARAQGVERLGDFADWSAFKFTEGDSVTCFIASEPTKAEGNYTARGEIHAMVTRRPAEDRIDEVSIQAGYVYQENAPVEIQVGAMKVKLFTQGETAWAVDNPTDRKLVDAMIRGSTMVVRGVSSRGTQTTDTYSLSGFTKAYRAIERACAG
ncbi:invasion associated locus B family protein [Pelagibius sp.]|uniref:invasion associated locus B family protein n=1 Tax=Pelagibius sp. TaxID=1931238 RepID=UPI003BB07C3E